MESSSEKNEVKGNSQMYAALSFALVMLIIGVPLWWHTTAVQRAPLPYQEIEALSSLINFRQKALVYLHCINVEKCLSLSQKLSKPVFDVDIEIHFALANHSSSTQVVDHEAAALDAKEGSVHLVEVPELSEQVLLLFGRHRNIYFSSNTPTATVLDALNSIYSSHTSHQKALVTPERRKHVDVAQLRHLPSSAHYSVLLSLICPTPATSSLLWDPQSEIKEWLSPFLDKLKAIASVTLRSQVVYADAIDLRPTWDGSHNRFYLHEEQLPLLLNPLDSKLGSQTSTVPSIHWAVWVPPTQYSPLYFHWGDQEVSSVFLSPKWGGLMVYNANPGQIDMKIVLATLLPQLRLQLGIQKQTFSMLSYDESALHDWELDYLMRSRAIENVRQAINTVQALGQLLDQISNIVISQGVADDIRLAVNNIMEAKEHLSDSRLGVGFLRSREALEAADRAFFHPTLLALLYFPDDQKYAIYIPLFLPVGIPVILSLKSIFFWLCCKLKSKHIKTD